MNKRISEQNLISHQEVASDSPGMATSREDLRLAELIQITRGVLDGIVGEATITQGSGQAFYDPSVIKRAIDIQQKYNFQPLGNNVDFSYLTAVISLDDFKKNPNIYFSKLAKGFGSFPLDFDFNVLLKNILGSAADLGFSCGILHFQHSGIFNRRQERPDVSGTKEEQEISFAKYFLNEKKNTVCSYAINKALVDSGCSTLSTEGYINIDILTFLKNYENIVDCVYGEIDDEGTKDNALKSLQAMKIVTLAMLKTVTNCVIVSPNDFFESEKISFEQIQEKSLGKDFSADQDNPFKPHNKEEEAIFLNLENMLVNTANGIGKTDVDKLIKLQNPEQFSFLVDALITKILSDPGMKKTWIQNNTKDLSEYDAKELIALATFLARYLVDKYENLDTMVDNVLHGFSPKSLTGKCTDYTGISLHIINNYLRIKYPEPFKNIIVGYDTQNIGDSYRHCYMKVYGYNAEGQIEVTFIDPTKLSSLSMDALRITDDIIKAVDSSNLPIQIYRSAEDIIIAKLREKTGGDGKISLSSSVLNLLEYMGVPENAINMSMSFVEKIKNMFRKR